MPIRIRPVFAGDRLKEAAQAAAECRPHLVEGLIYEQSVLLLSADPGTGKSTVGLCAAAQMSAGLPVFGQLPCSRPLRVYILLSERTAQEPLERLRLMLKIIQPDWRNLVIDDGFAGLCNVARPEHCDEIFKSISGAWPEGPDLIQLDPIYGLIPGGLSKDEKASEFCRFTAGLQSRLGCALWLNHHTTKDQYSRESGSKIEKDDPFYGSQWLKAHATAAYHLKGTDTGVTMLRKKDSYSTLLKEIPLEFDPLTFTVHLDAKFGTMSARDRLWHWLNFVSGAGRAWSFAEMCAENQLSNATGRNLLLDNSIRDRIEEVNRLGRKIIYRAKPA